MQRLLLLSGVSRAAGGGVLGPLEGNMGITELSYGFITPFLWPCKKIKARMLSARVDYSELVGFAGETFLQREFSGEVQVSSAIAS